MPTLTRHFLCNPNRSLYWSLTTLTTVGYGDISPTNITEMTYGVLMFVVGAVVYASIFANVTSLMGKFDEAKNRYTDSISSIAEFFRVRRSLALLCHAYGFT